MASSAGCLLFAILAQEGTLDVLDGETLYEEGWLFTATTGIEATDGLLDGSDAAPDPLDVRRFDRTLWLGAHYGLRYNLQLGAIFPYVRRTRADATGRLEGEGAGDASFLAKWRVYRWDAPHKALNLSILAGIETPTGSDSERQGGARLPPELQPGSGSWDPFAGVALTHEPGRWRFNAFVLYQANTRGAQEHEFGDELHVEVSAGNRFWLEPYPGPFMRLDASVRFRRTWRDRQDGAVVGDSGGTLSVLALNWAFRPRPSLDFQLEIELPLHQHVQGVQPEREYSVTFAFGVRI